MLTLVTGKPGSGKTQYVIERFIIEARRENPNRPIFSNIRGLNISAVQERTGGDPVQPAPDDWRTCPDGSLVIYDEAQSEHLFPATGKPGMPSDERLLRLDTHRHRGFDIVLITQDHALVHHWARKFVGRHLFLSRPSGAEMFTVYEWDSVQSDPDDFFAKQKADTHLRKMDSAIWKLYDSATVHTHKFTMPKGAKSAIRMFLGLVVIFGGALIWNAWAARSEPETEPQTSLLSEGLDAFIPAVQDIRAVSSAFEWRSASEVEPINGCAASELRCRCWTFDGKLLDLEEATCRNLAEGVLPMPIDTARFRQTSSAGQGVGGGAGAARPAPPASASLLPSSNRSAIALPSGLANSPSR